jgi:predicted DNA-binding transcriptional regulator YafY
LYFNALGVLYKRATDSIVSVVWQAIMKNGVNMRKASRLFEIIQILRLARKPVTSAQIAARLEVTQRSIYRDIAALQAMRVPIEGGRGIGYILRPGFNLPPLMFSIEETEALVLALALLERTGDGAMVASARSITRKIAAALPQPLQDVLETTALHAWGSGMSQTDSVDTALLRRAIREEQILDIVYSDENQRQTTRSIKPLALIYYTQWLNVVAWCELRQDFRNFRNDRMTHIVETGRTFAGEGEGLRQKWMAGWSVRQTGQPAGRQTKN